MKFNKLKDDLIWRGLLKDIANENSLKKIVEDEGFFYIGIDPTADSIHVGHFLSLNLAKLLNSYGLKPILVLGGFTGMIGDPSGRNSEREVINRDKIIKNSEMIEKQLEELANKLEINNFEIFNNVDVYEKMSIVDLYQNYGKIFNLNTMLSKESVKNRIENGISYTEFSYQIFQAIDYLYLFETKNVRLQLGGSDQWGNIVSGIDLIKKIHGSDIDVSGVTINLLTDERGNKIGKTQGNPMWLNKNKTSVYSLFQYFINLTDETATKVLAQATDILENEYNKIISEHKINPHQKIIQKELAKRFISKIHSVKDYQRAIELSDLLFNEKYFEIKENQLNDLKTLPSFQNKNIKLMDLLIEKNKIESRRSYRDFLKNNAIKINGKLINDENLILTDDFFIIDKVAFINIGKKNKYLIWKK